MKYWKINIVFQIPQNTVKVIVPGDSFSAAVTKLFHAYGNSPYFSARVSGTASEQTVVMRNAVARFEDCGPVETNS